MQGVFSSRSFRGGRAIAKASIVALWLGLAASATAGEIRIVTEPPGAEVWVGLARLGTTTGSGLRISTPGAGTVIFTIRKEGFAAEQKTVKVEASAPITVVVTLRPLGELPSGSPPAGPPPPPRAVSTPSPEPAPAPIASPPASVPAGETQGGGHKGLVLGALGVAAAGGATAIVVAKHSSGGCSSGGGLTIDVVPDLKGQVNCNTPTQPITVSGTNLDCSAVTITSASVSASLTGGSCAGGGFTRTLKVVATSVPSGARNVPIAEGFIGNSVAGCCLNGGSCGSSGFQCDETEVYTVQTSQGPVTSTNSYTITFPAGFSCVPCDPASASCRGPVPSGTR